MTAKILDGKALAKSIRKGLAEETAELAKKGIVPGLAVVLVGDDPASAIYVRNKERAAKRAGIHGAVHRLPAEASHAEVMELVGRLNDDPEIDGYIVQVPLPDQIDPIAIQDAIAPGKDVDGFTAENIGLLAQGRPRFVAATPKGCMRLVAESGIDLSGKSAVVVGRSNIVGKPMAMLLTNAHATVSICHSRTKDLAERVRGADIVIAAVGRPEMVRGEWIKEGAVVIDVGITRNAEGKLIGDVEFAAAAERASAITPVPGGVGPMTIASLLENAVMAAKLRADKAG